MARARKVMTAEVRERLRAAKEAGRINRTLAGVPHHLFCIALDEYESGRRPEPWARWLLVGPGTLGTVAADAPPRVALGMVSYTTRPLHTPHDLGIDRQTAGWAVLKHAPPTQIEQMLASGMRRRPVAMPSWNGQKRLIRTATAWPAADLIGLFALMRTPGETDGDRGRVRLLEWVRKYLLFVTDRYTHQHPGTGAVVEFAQAVVLVNGGRPVRIAPGDRARVQEDKPAGFLAAFEPADPDRDGVYVGWTPGLWRQVA